MTCTSPTLTSISTKQHLFLSCCFLQMATAWHLLAWASLLTQLLLHRQLCQTFQMIDEPACHIPFWKYLQVNIRKQTRSKSKHLLLTQWTNCWADFSWQLRKGSPTPDLQDPDNPYHVCMRSLQHREQKLRIHTAAKSYQTLSKLTHSWT